MPPSPPAGASAPPVPASFRVGDHVLSVERLMEGRWSVKVDGQPVSGTFRTQADAWEAGVREADRIDRAARAP